MHEGTKTVKINKLQQLTTRFESIRMSGDECFDELYAKLNDIVNFAYNMCEIYCQILNIQNNWQIVNTNLSRYRSQSLQVLLDNAQGDSSQDSRTYKLQEEDFIFCLVRSIEEQARSIENRTCRILSRPKQQLKPIKDQGFRSTSPTI